MTELMKKENAMEESRRLQVYEVEPDYTFVCAYTPQGAKRVYMENSGMTEDDWEREVNDECVVSVENMIPMTDKQLSKYLYGDEGDTFADELARRTNEEIFAMNE
jgi:hypothetical protein